LASHATWNPCNLYWKRAYRRYAAGRKVTVLGLRLVSPFLSTAWRRYHPLFLSTIQHKAAIIDFDDSAAVVGFFKEHQTDLLVVNVWGLLPTEIIDAPRYKTVNVHPSKLPQYRSSVPTLMTLKNGDAVSAVSYILLDATVDGGHLIGQHEFAVSSADDYRTIEDKVTSITEQTLLSDIAHYIEGTHKPEPQNESLRSVTPSYARYMRVDWQNETAADIYNKVNLYPYLEIFDYCYSFFNGIKISLKGVLYTNKLRTLPPGAFEVHGFSLYIGTSDKPLRCALGKDISIKDSIRIFFKRSGIATAKEKKA
jgi:methionyl-tRNA formyltransferase